VSLCPGLQQLDTAPSQEDPPRAGAGHWPTSPNCPNAPSTPGYRLVAREQSTLNHQSQTKVSMLKIVPLGQRKEVGKRMEGEMVS